MKRTLDQADAAIVITLKPETEDDIARVNEFLVAWQEGVTVEFEGMMWWVPRVSKSVDQDSYLYTIWLRLAHGHPSRIDDRPRN